MSAGTLSKLNLKSRFQPSIICEKIKIGNFTVVPFKVKHDAAEPIGFFINHPVTGNVLFATDTYFLPNRFANLNNILIEANYSTALLKRNIEAGRIPPMLRDRTLQSHMSYETCKEALLANDLSKVNNIILIHLSNGNSNADEFQADMQAATGKTIHIADSGMQIHFLKTPF
jgi:phosphoribosyl 1,2-cyclic phosphodiesterase